jgi:hypothetical protein
MGKLFRKTRLSENSFEAAPGGKSGTLTYQTPYGTPGGGDYVQDPRHFASSDQSTDNFEPNTSKGSGALPQLPNRPDVVNKSANTIDQTTSPAAAAEKKQSEKPLDPTKEFDPQVDQIFQKKDTPSPDEIMAAVQYELGNMVKKDKAIAKQTVLSNYKEDPHYYSRLNMLNIDDDKMKVDETIMKEQTKLVNQSTFEKTKALLDSMVADRQKNVAVANTPEINQIFKDLTDKRQARKMGQSQ